MDEEPGIGRRVGRRLRIIGAGSRSTTWAPVGGGPAFKLEENGIDRSLENDFNMHERVVRSFQSLPRFPRIQVPDCYNFIKATDGDWWNRCIERFPKARTPCNCMLVERILPFPREIINLLAYTCCPPGIALDSILQAETNEGCLIRPYLGCCLPQQPRAWSQQQVFWSTDSTLRLNQMEELAIPTDDIKQYARTMAEAFAIMHWIGRIDGNGIDFVLAPPWGEIIKADTVSNVLGEHCMWVLDFNLCRDMPMDEAGVQQAATAFWRNDPFYPRPAKKDALWHEFREQYLYSSDERLEYCCLADAKRDRRKSLSRLFIEIVENGGGINHDSN